MAVYIKLPTGLVDEMIDPAMPVEALVGLNQWLLGALSQEPTTGVPGPVTRDIRYARGELSMTRDEVMESLVANPIGPGDPNPLFRILDSIDKQKETDKNVAAVASYGSVWSETATIGPVLRDEWKKTGYLYGLVMAGGDVTGLDCWFAVPESQYQDDVPELLPNRLKESGEVDESGEPITVAKTWAEWNEVAHSGPWGGVMYVPSSAGDRYSMTIAPAIFAANSVGIGIVSAVDFIPIMQANAPSEPI